MAEDVEDDPTYLDEVVEETPMLFASSETVLTIEDPNLHPMGKATAIFLLFTCMMGFLNGLDFASPDDGLVRPDEFVNRLALMAPDDTATFRGTVVDEAGQPVENATVYLHGAFALIAAIHIFVRLTAARAKRRTFYGPRCLASLGMCSLAPVVSSKLDAPAAALLLGSIVLSVVTMHPEPDVDLAAEPAADDPRSPAGRLRRHVNNNKPNRFD